ncbi:MAG: hypothetical protein A2Y40_09460 [Candidatus Margulisbacteria bacterium GWF2_35_9]|nr:MAG: hypothetical protein A2Y40_09460 [Candidatus Margulisbacteria bacterium GWF2_35_9]
MDVFYVAYIKEKELKMAAFTNKDELNSFVKGLKESSTEHDVVKLKNNTSVNGFINFLTDNKLSEAYHEMMQRGKKN